MSKLDKVEMVREKTGVTYEEAREALEQCDYDVLDAVVLLERQGKVQTSTAHHTTSASEPSMSAEMVQAQQRYEESSRQRRVREGGQRFVETLKHLCSRGLEVSFVVERNGSQVLSLPVLILLILILFLFPATIPLLVVGLFFGFRYHFDGLNTTTVDVNDMMGKVADGAESLKHTVMDDE